MKTKSKLKITLKDHLEAAVSLWRVHGECGNCTRLQISHVWQSTVLAQGGAWAWAVTDVRDGRMLLESVMCLTVSLLA